MSATRGLRGHSYWWPSLFLSFSSLHNPWINEFFLVVYSNTSWKTNPKYPFEKGYSVSAEKKLSNPYCVYKLANRNKHWMLCKNGQIFIQMNGTGQPCVCLCLRWSHLCPISLSRCVYTRRSKVTNDNHDDAWASKYLHHQQHLLGRLRIQKTHEKKKFVMPVRYIKRWKLSHTHMTNSTIN